MTLRFEGGSHYCDNVWCRGGGWR